MRPSPIGVGDRTGAGGQWVAMRGQGEALWLLDRFRSAVPVIIPYVESTTVDGLASPGKHLEIEITAKLPAR